MRPVLFSFLGLDVQTYGVSKVVAAWVAAVLLARGFAREGLDRTRAYNLVFWLTVWSFVCAKAYYLLERLPAVTLHDPGGMGFTRYGGFIGGALTALVLVRRWQLPLGAVAGLASAPLAVAYAVGRLGCLVAGDGTYGRPSTVPWAMTFPNGVVATETPVHPTPLYEALTSLAIAGVLMWLTRRASGPAVFASYLILSGAAWFLIEFVRTNPPAAWGMSQPQMWSLLSVIGGATLFDWTLLRGHTGAATHRPQNLLNRYTPQVTGSDPGPAAEGVEVSAVKDDHG